VFPEIRDEFPLRVGDGDVQRHEFDAAADPLALGRERRGARRGQQHGHRESAPARRRSREKLGHRAPARPVRVRARAVYPGLVTVTSISSGGISVSGRPYVTTYWLTSSPASCVIFGAADVRAMT